MNYAKLYKRTSTGKIQEWEIEVDGDKYRTISGQQDGKKIVNAWTTCVGKNIGRANETTPEQQAEFEANAKWEKQQNAGRYSLDIATVDEEDYIQVMLATTYNKVKGKMSFKGALAQPKLDGIRFVATLTHSHSRKGKQLGGMNLIRAKMDKMFEDHPEVITDGEGYTHTHKDKFNQISSMIKRTTINPDLAEEILDILEYHIYDVLAIGNLTEKDPYVDRMTAFWEMVNSEYPELLKWLKYVPYYPVQNHDDITKYFEMFVDAGYEGAIVRYNRRYEHKRSKFLIKIKLFEDTEFRILEIIEGVGNRAGMAGAIRVQLDKGVTPTDTEFKSGIKGGFDFYTELWNDRDKLIGKTATIRFFGRNPDTGIPRFPVTVNVGREDYE